MMRHELFGSASDGDWCSCRPADVSGRRLPGEGRVREAAGAEASANGFGVPGAVSESEPDGQRVEGGDRFEVVGAGGVRAGDGGFSVSAASAFCGSPGSSSTAAVLTDWRMILQSAILIGGEMYVNYRV